MKNKILKKNFYKETNAIFFYIYTEYSKYCDC